MILLVAIIGASTCARGEPEPAPAWVILVYECERPVGILMQTDPPQWFPGSALLTPDVSAQILLAVKAKRSIKMIVGLKCGDKLSV
jgi:hypothetical protein